MAAALIVTGVVLLESYGPHWQADGAEPQPSTTRAAATKRALLVACTTYDAAGIRDLKGPANDVALMQDLLTRRFGFPEEELVVLQEESRESVRPTRANIVREIEALIARAGAGDQVVLFLAGHGSQQPDQSPPDSADEEPDGFDEIFLPVDTTGWNDDGLTVGNAIIDDELRNWLGQLLAAGAEVLVILDACHSGTGIRGDEVARQVEPELLIPEDVLERARQRAGAVRGLPVETESPCDPLGAGDWVAIYAAHADETEPERPFPPGRPSAEQKHYGLLSYTMYQTLNSNVTPSYRELVQRVKGHYLARGILRTTPLVEGTVVDRTVLGAGRQPQFYSLLVSSMRLQAGQLHGLADGTILAVFSPTARNRDQPIGHVRVTNAGLAEAVVAPCAYAGQAANANLPAGALCRVVSKSCGDLRLAVTVDDSGRSRPEDAARLHAALEEIAAAEQTPIQLVDRREEAEWVAVPGTNGWVLTTLSGAREPRGVDRVSAPELPLDTGNVDALKRQLSRVARVQTLLKIADVASSTSGDTDPLPVTLEMFVKRPDEASPHALAPDERLAPGDRVQWRISNESDMAVDATLLLIDAGCGISALVPSRTWRDSRLDPGEHRSTGWGTVNAVTVGWEHVVLLAVRGGRDPVNFAFLAQPTWEEAERDIATRGVEHALETPLGQLLADAFYRSGVSSRGLDASLAKEQRIRILSWITAAERAAPR